MFSVWKSLAVVVFISLMNVTFSAVLQVTCPNTVTCHDGQHCEMKTVPCYRAPCPQKATCVQNACAMVECDVKCVNGYVYNIDNCKTCQCKTAPTICGNVQCGLNQVCQELKCFRPPCGLKCVDAA